MPRAREECGSFNAKFLQLQQFELRGQCDSIFHERGQRRAARKRIYVHGGSPGQGKGNARRRRTRCAVAGRSANDPVNLMSYVTMVFQRVFGYPREKAELHMLEVHHKGRSILWSGVREPAEFYVQQLHGYLLLATLEKVV